MTITIRNKSTSEEAKYELYSYEEHPYRILAEVLEDTFGLLLEDGAEEFFEEDSVCLAFDGYGNRYYVEEAYYDLYIITDMI